MPLGKLKKAFAERVGVPVTSLCYLYKNRRVDDGDTPSSLGQKDGDSLRVVGKVQLQIGNPV